ncbi:SIMPL domain-containing protein [Alteromonadaceae bacterium M269]|nr:SIMPL domain-containing protein [Alteromonadaceae bacterium M269]
MKISLTNSFMLAAGVAICGYFISQTLYNSKVAINTSEVKGLAERQVKANTANWELFFTVSDDTSSSLSNLYQSAEERQEIIINLLKEQGFEDSEIDLGVINLHHQEFRDKNQKLVENKRSLIGSISVSTSKVDLVSSVRSEINKLIAKGIEIENHAPIYRFTQLNDIKPDMLKEATLNARNAAKEFAEVAGVSVGRIQQARQGNFSIRDIGSNYSDTTKIMKDVRVVTTIVFYLTE